MNHIWVIIVHELKVAMYLRRRMIARRLTARARANEFQKFIANSLQTLDNRYI
jgi:hypothetical protein